MNEPLYVLPAELTIAHVEQCREALMQLVESHDVIALDDSNLARIDTLGIQLLLSLVIHLSSQNKTLEWQCHSEIIKQSIKQLGIDEPILNQYMNY
jgi:anti-anti-sigma regulatory factor